nr:RAV-2 protin [Morus alba]
MEEDMSSTVLNGGGNATPEAIDSNSCAHLLPPPNKRASHSGFRASPLKFKGLVPQQSGHWGAQIYANHQRIWLGTFKSDKEAAMAYDSAAIRLRSADSHRNFPWTSVTLKEPKFQEAYTTDALLGMIKDGSYPSKFVEYLMARYENLGTDIGRLDLTMVQTKGLVFKQLFQKELTPSDVGKLNRLVIPKKYAVKYFPRIEEGSDNDVELEFHDRTMRLWKFRYCYWRRSQSFVFTRGWTRFVKEKQLRENDTITFYLCEYCQEGERAVRTFTAIDVFKVENINGGLVEENKDKKQTLGLHLDLNLGMLQSSNYDHHKDGIEVEGEKEVPVKAKPIIPKAGNSGFWLFGVHII